MTREQAKALIAENKDYTGYFDGSCTLDQMYEMLAIRKQFRDAESKVIIAALKLAGAKFRKDVYSYFERMIEDD